MNNMNEINNEIDIKNQKHSLIQDFIKQLSLRIKQKKELDTENDFNNIIQNDSIFVIDRFEGNLAVCENRNNRSNVKYKYIKPT